MKRHPKDVMLPGRFDFVQDVGAGRKVHVIIGGEPWPSVLCGTTTPREWSNPCSDEFTGFDAYDKQYVCEKCMQCVDDVMKAKGGEA